MQALILGADHAGFKLKESIKQHLLKRGLKIHDATPVFQPGDDYPPIAKKVARLVSKNNAQAILICGSGYGMDIAANRLRGARAIVARTIADAKRSKQEDQSNILVLGGRVTPSALAKKMVDAWIRTPYADVPRFARRVKQIDQA